MSEQTVGATPAPHSRTTDKSEPHGHDHITLTGIPVFAHHGVLAQERRDGQTFIVDVVAWLDLAPAAQDDDLLKTVNYAELAEHVVATVKGEPVNLIETVAENVANAVLQNALIERVRITIHKPQAPIPVEFGDVSVTVERQRA